MTVHRSDNLEPCKIRTYEMDGSTLKHAVMNSKSSSKCHNNNFKAGYMAVDTAKPEMRGRKTFAFWTLLVLLFLLVIGNFALTITIIRVLKLGQGEYVHSIDQF